MNVVGSEDTNQCAKISKEMPNERIERVRKSWHDESTSDETEVDLTETEHPDCVGSIVVGFSVHDCDKDEKTVEKGVVGQQTWTGKKEDLPDTFRMHEIGMRIEECGEIERTTSRDHSRDNHISTAGTASLEKCSQEYATKHHSATAPSSHCSVSIAPDELMRTEHERRMYEKGFALTFCEHSCASSVTWFEGSDIEEVEVSTSCDTSCSSDKTSDSYGQAQTL